MSRIFHTQDPRDKSRCLRIALVKEHVRSAPYPLDGTIPQDDIDEYGRQQFHHLTITLIRANKVKPVDWSREHLFNRYLNLCSIQAFKHRPLRDVMLLADMLVSWNDIHPKDRIKLTDYLSSQPNPIPGI